MLNTQVLENLYDIFIKTFHYELKYNMSKGFCNRTSDLNADKTIKQ